MFEYKYLELTIKEVKKIIEESMNIRHNQFIEIVLYRLKEIIPSFFVKMFENIRKCILNDRITPSEILQRDIFIID